MSTINLHVVIYIFLQIKRKAFKVCVFTTLKALIFIIYYLLSIYNYIRAVAKLFNVLV